MDRELAEAVFLRWAEGEPVFEGTLYKAAEALGEDPDAVLGEARFVHYFDRLLVEKRAMTLGEQLYFSAAAGIDPLEMSKTASAYGLDREELIFSALADRNFTPDLFKIAALGMLGGPPGQGMDAGAPPAAQAQAAPPPEAPQPGAQVQQQPDARMMALQPGPTAPQGQLPASPQGNFDQLLQGAQQADTAQMGGGLPPTGMGAEQTPPPPSSSDRISQVFQGQLDADTLERYAGELEQFEQQLGMTVNDPKQIEKFVKELQKNEKKVVDTQIKQYSEMKAQQVAAPQGPPAPTLDATAPTALPAAIPGAGAPQPDPSQQAAALAKVASAAIRAAHATR